MKIDIWELILFSFYKSNIKQTIKYYNLIPAQLYPARYRIIRPDAGSEGVSGTSLQKLKSFQDVLI